MVFLNFYETAERGNISQKFKYHKVNKNLDKKTPVQIDI